MYKFETEDLEAFAALSKTGVMTEDAWYAFGEFVEGLETRIDILLTEMVGETSDSYSVTSGGIEAHYSTYSCGYTENEYETIPFHMLMDDAAIKKIKVKKEADRLAHIKRQQREAAARKVVASHKKAEEERFKRFKEHEANHGAFDV